jgi:hypothetical protein
MVFLFPHRRVVSEALVVSSFLLHLQVSSMQYVEVRFLHLAHSLVTHVVASCLVQMLLAQQHTLHVPQHQLAHLKHPISALWSVRSS